MRSRFRIYWKFVRPFTLIAPALGMFSGGVTALGAVPATPVTPWIVVKIALGTLMAALLNGASNALNQIYDLENDRINKPNRMIPAGVMTIREAAWVAAVLYASSLTLAAIVGAQCLLLAATAAILTYVYSAPPFRTKRAALTANLTIAVPRGLLLKVAGWSTVKTIFTREAWVVGLIFGVFLLGATTTKDFADMEGDRAAGCRTLPVVYGVRKAAWITAPFFVVPFLLMPIGAHFGFLTGNEAALTILGVGCALWGSYVAYLIVRRPEELAATENHVSWVHMYSMMFVCQIGFALAYLL
jgi:4-hydroxybenzoate polyprenyltransferase